MVPFALLVPVWAETRHRITVGLGESAAAARRIYRKRVSRRGPGSIRRGPGLAGCSPGPSGGAAPLAAQRFPLRTCRSAPRPDPQNQLVRVSTTARAVAAARPARLQPPIACSPMQAARRSLANWRPSDSRQSCASAARTAAVTARRLILFSVAARGNRRIGYGWNKIAPLPASSTNLTSDFTCSFCVYSESEAST